MTSLGMLPVIPILEVHTVAGDRVTLPFTIEQAAALAGLVAMF